MDSLAHLTLNATNYIVYFFIFNIRFRKAKIVQNFFPQVSYFSAENVNFGAFKKRFLKIIKLFKIMAEILVLFCHLFSLNNSCKIEFFLEELT